MFEVITRYKQTWQFRARKFELLAVLQWAWSYLTNYYVTLKVIERCWSSREPSWIGRTFTQNGKHHCQRWWCFIQERKWRRTRRRAYKCVGYFFGWILGDIQFRIWKVREETVTIWICSWSKRNVLATLHVNVIRRYFKFRKITRN